MNSSIYVDMFGNLIEYKQNKNYDRENTKDILDIQKRCPHPHLDIESVEYLKCFTYGTKILRRF